MSDKLNKLHTLDDVLDIVNKEIEDINYSSYNPQSLFDPITYILSLGGKRVRPALALMAYNLYKNDVEKAIPIALGIEVFHNFTLLHDDLMDKADVRRGKPTVHLKWSDNIAILSGDAMLIEAYKELSKIDVQYLKECLDLFSQTATEICCGQQLDMEFEQRLDVSVDEYIEMIRLKTAVLLGCALLEGALVAGASDNDQKKLYQFGIYLGLAFQIKDDLLDVYGDPATFGKRIGGDILCNKKTYLLTNALCNGSKRAELLNWIGKEHFDEEEKIKAVTEIYNELGVKKLSEDAILKYYKLAIEMLDSINIEKDLKKELYDLAENLLSRNV